MSGHSNHNIDIFVILMTLSAIIYAFMEIDIIAGFVVLVIGGAFLLFWLQHRTKIFD